MRASDLAAEVRATEYSGTTLGADLDRLERVAGVDAPEAAVFYAGRILEVLIAEEVRALGGEPSNNVYGNLVRLSELGVIPEFPARLAHALRRVANEARHVQRHLTDDDVSLVRALLVHVLRWHFSAFPRGPRLPSLWAHDSPELDPLALFVDSLELGEAIQQKWDADPRFARSSLTSALYIETLIADGSEDARIVAERVITDALTRHPKDLRLRQLDGWLARLRGDLDASAQKLEAVLDESEDVETVGLLAGTYKRMGKLQRSAELYRRAWKQSERRSTYAGINAASMSLLAGQRDVASQIAMQVLGLFERRNTQGGALEFTGYWELATYAEAKLLTGDVDGARALYRRVFSTYASQRGWIASTRSQLEQLLRVLGGGNVETFLTAV
ncbi:MAG TPA: TRAFs-binding domain-containing protein [Kofleriaceae bacterium]|nr:TRAFs-binding domain-containing protein [Kofleriaceae bacterium]